MAKALSKALCVAWLLLSGLLLPVLAATFVLPEDRVAALAQACRSQRHGEERCPLCGMTRALLRLRRGDLRGAMASNGAALPLLVALATNQAAAGWVICRRRNRQERIIMVDKAGD